MYTLVGLLAACSGAGLALAALRVYRRMPGRHPDLPAELIEQLYIVGGMFVEPRTLILCLALLAAASISAGTFLMFCGR